MPAQLNDVMFVEFEFVDLVPDQVLGHIGAKEKSDLVLEIHGQQSRYHGIELFPAQLAVISRQLHELDHPFNDLLALNLESLAGARECRQIDAPEL